MIPKLITFIFSKQAGDVEMSSIGCITDCEIPGNHHFMGNILEVHPVVRVLQEEI
jgi:hypothetical protein